MNDTETVCREARSDISVHGPTDFTIYTDGSATEGTHDGHNYRPQGRSDGGGYIGYIYPPKISSSKLLWDNSDVRTVNEHEY